jgi:tetratricopeptide (TPR) repeat protein
MNAPGAKAPPPVARSRKRRRLAAAVFGVALLAATGGVGWYFLGGPSPPSVNLGDADPDVREAVEAARTAVRWSPRSAPTWGRLGTVLLANGHEAEAGACFARAEQLDAHEPRWPYLRGTVLLRHEPDEALACWRRAADRCGSTPDAPRLRLAEALLEQGRLDEAEDHFNQLIRQDPSHARAHLGLARLACLREDWAGARSHLGPAADHPLTRKAAQALLAEAHRGLGDSASAEEALRHLAELPRDPPWPDPFLEEVRAVAAGKQVYLDRVTRLRREGRLDEAREVGRQLEQRYPDLFWLVDGRLWLDRGDYARAEESLRKAVELSPGLVDAHFSLGDALAARSKDAEAAACYRKVTELEPTYGPAYASLGACLKRQGQRRDAVTAFQTAVCYAPLQANLRRELGELLCQERRAAEGVQQLRHAVRLDPGDHKAAELLEQALKQEREARPPDR